jgi:hypothetical protein
VRVVERIVKIYEQVVVHEGGGRSVMRSLKGVALSPQRYEQTATSPNNLPIYCNKIQPIMFFFE